MANKPQNFSTDHIMSQLVAYFNALPAAQRVIRANDVPFYNIKVITGPNGENKVVAGDAAKDVPASSYLGEATFTWVGPRHATNPQTATAARFFEVSKFVNSAGGSVTVKSMEGTYTGLPTITLPQAGDYTYYLVMTDQYGDSWNNGSIVLSIAGVDYTLYGPPNDVPSQTVTFGASIDDTVTIKIGDPGQYPDEMIVQLYQAPHGQPQSSAIAVRSDSTAIPADGSNFVDFVVPYVYDALSTRPYTFQAINLGTSTGGGYNSMAVPAEDINTIALGIPGANEVSGVDTYESGKVVVVMRKGGSFNNFPTAYKQTITRQISCKNFGGSIATSADGLWLAVGGTTYEGYNGSDYVFLYSRPTNVDDFTYAQTITTVATGWYAGGAPILAFTSDNQLVIADAAYGNFQGRVMIYGLSGGTWLQTSTINTPTTSIQFARKVAVDSTAAVPTICVTSAAGLHFYMYDTGTSAWTRRYNHDASTSYAGDSVSVNMFDDLYVSVAGNSNGMQLYTWGGNSLTPVATSTEGNARFGYGTNIDSSNRLNYVSSNLSPNKQTVYRYNEDGSNNETFRIGGWTDIGYEIESDAVKATYILPTGDEMYFMGRKSNNDVQLLYAQED